MEKKRPHRKSAPARPALLTRGRARVKLAGASEILP